MERAQSLRSRQLAAIAAVLAALLLACMQSGRAEPTISTPGPLGKPVPMHELEAVVAAQIADANVAGAVVAIGDASGVRERVALGQRTVGRDAEPMTEDTIFDLASLTKAVATSTAVLQLAERGRLDLEAPAGRYWPAFADGGKSRITIRQLLTHTSGLPPGLAARSELRGPASVLHAIGIMPPNRTGSHASSARTMRIPAVRVSGWIMRALSAGRVHSVRVGRREPRGPAIRACGSR